MKSAFLHWYNEVSDMPHKHEDGVWEDLETGITFNQYLKAEGKTRKSRYVPSEKAKDFRAVAKFFGGKALKGTAKQKEWAEKIRAERLKASTPEQAELLCFLSMCEHAKWWIETRNADVKEIAKAAEEAATLIKKANKVLRDAERICAENSFVVTAEYNEKMSEREGLIDRYEEIKAGNLKS